MCRKIDWPSRRVKRYIPRRYTAGLRLLPRSLGLDLGPLSPLLRLPGLRRLGAAPLRLGRLRWFLGFRVSSLGAAPTMTDLLQ